MKKHTFALCLAAALIPQAYAETLSSDNLVWKAVTFGQSTDLNFGSTILPEKVGLNQVTVNGKEVKEGPLEQRFTIESRGGKLANSHEGLTFYYTEIPTSYNFTLSADIELIQLGPETGATPNRQEGAGIMVRDIVGAERLVPQPEGHEEFPSASNMVMNLLRSHSRTNDGMVNINASFREGVYQPWGTAGNRLSRVDYREGVSYGETERYSMSLTRTNEGFEVAYRNGEEHLKHHVAGANANIVQMQDAESQYVGFFASRNAKVNVENVELALSPAKTVNAPKFQANQDEVVFQVASPSVSVVDDYTLQARSNYSGVYQVYHQGFLLDEAKVNAGDLYRHAILLKDASQVFDITFTPIEGPSVKPVKESIVVERVEISNPNAIYVSPTGTSAGTGSSTQPLDLESAIQMLPPGGVIKLLSGDYDATTIPISASGSADAVKTLTKAGDNVRFVGNLIHEANYWKYEDIEVSGALFVVHGSHNTFERMTTHGAPDTGFQITSPERIGRALWASYNTVIDSESYNNMDPSQINADGFAAKMRVGDGNTFIRCVAHHNIDDGWDLFNKVEDGPNGAVTIIDSIAFSNGRTLDVANKGGTIGNGFKLGGEGLPVPHVIKNSLSFNNNMDGFTDNFNPGTVTVSNNIAIDNKRFNFLFRQSPYSQEVKQGVFSNNKSLRFHVDSRYDDVVNSSEASNNRFISDGVTVDVQGKPVDMTQFKRLKQASIIDLDQPVPGMLEAKAVKALIDSSLN